MTSITGEQDAAEAYYDTHVIGKLAGYVDVNRRVEQAWQTILKWAPREPHRILEIGCGIGDISHRLSLAWPGAQIVGIDISPRSIEIATTLFGSERVSYTCGYLSEGMFTEKFDLVIMMDMYEHLASEHRPGFHAAIAGLLAPDGRVALSFPTPRKQAYLRRFDPGGLQPVDEDIDAFTMASFAQDLNTGLLYYSEVSVWEEGDYGHAVLGRRPPFAAAAPAPAAQGFKGRVKSILGPNTLILTRLKRRLKDYAEVVRPQPAHGQSTRSERLRRVKDRLGNTFGID